VLPLANSDGLELGEKLVIIDDSITIDIVSKFIDDYIPPSSTNSKPQKRVMITSRLDDSFSGAAVSNLKGEIIGISSGDNLFIATNELKEFISSVIK
jgi:translation initiation factor 2 gamma subunit (eIF-2gamma)